MRHQAFMDAAELGGPEMVAAVAERLYDGFSCVDRTLLRDGFVIEGFSLPSAPQEAVAALVRMVDDPSAPKTDLPERGCTLDDVIAWRRWWEANTAAHPKGRPAGKYYRDYPEWKAVPFGGILCDLMDEDEIAARRTLLDRGEAIHEAMLAVLWQCDDTSAAQFALNILWGSKGGKDKVVEELRRYLAERLREGVGDRDVPTCVHVAEILAKHGSEEDARALLPLLAHSDRRLLCAGAAGLGACGGGDVLETLEAAKGQAHSPWERQVFERAIGAIRARLGLAEDGKGE